LLHYFFQAVCWTQAVNSSPCICLLRFLHHSCTTTSSSSRCQAPTRTHSGAPRCSHANYAHLALLRCTARPAARIVASPGNSAQKKQACSHSLGHSQSSSRRSSERCFLCELNDWSTQTCLRAQRNRRDCCLAGEWVSTSSRAIFKLTEGVT
jgi:hypothetical protein